MNSINYETLKIDLQGQKVDRPNRAISGTLSGHAAGEPFEKCVYR